MFLNRHPNRGNKYRTLAWHLMSDYFTGALREVRRKWDAIEVDRLRPKAKVKITGEFWLQTWLGLLLLLAVLMDLARRALLARMGSLGR